MRMSLPNAECVGIDPFEAQVIEARKRAQKSGLSNVSYFSHWSRRTHQRSWSI